MAKNAAIVLSYIDFVGLRVAIVDDPDVQEAVVVVITEERVARNGGRAESGDNRRPTDFVERAAVVAVQLVLSHAEVAIGYSDYDVQITVVVEVAEIHFLLVLS